MQIPARLTLFGWTPTPVVLSVEPRPRWERILRAFLTLFLATLTAPIVMLIPPHAEWLMLNAIAGLYWFRKNWIAEYVLDSFDGVCPRCHHAITLKPGMTLRFPEGVSCYHCHEHPTLEPGEAPPLQPRSEDATVEIQKREHAEVRPLRIWSPSSSEW
jgi:hypothetical protein